MFKSVFFEFIGTFALMLAASSTADPLVVSATVFFLIVIFYKYSGAHFNPGISLAFFCLNRITLRGFLAYICAQLLGAALACVLLYSFNMNYFFLYPGAGYRGHVTFMYEFLFSSIFFTTFLFTTVPGKEHRHFELASASALFLGINCTGAISGGVFNPALGICSSLFSFFVREAGAENIVLYTMAPSLAAVSAVGLYIFAMRGEKT